MPDEQIEQQGELELKGDLRGLDWAIIIATPGEAAAREAAGEITWQGDAYYTAGAAGSEAEDKPPLAWLAAIAGRLAGETRLSHAEFRVLLMIIYRAGRKQKAWPSMRTIAADADVALSMVVKSLQRLEELGYISCEKRGNRSNLYSITAPGGIAPVYLSEEHGVPLTDTRCSSERHRTIKGTEKGTESIGETDLFGEEIGGAPDPKSPSDLFAQVLPEKISSDPAAMVALGKFVLDRKERKKPLTSRAIRILCERIKDWEPEDVAAAALTAIEKSWLTLYAPNPVAPAGEVKLPASNFEGWKKK
jgi:hypothetical protein